MSLQLVITDLPQPQERLHRTIIATTVNELVLAHRRLELPAVDYTTSITPDASAGGTFTITATNGTAFTINAPLNGSIGQKILFILRNASGGAMGAITWDAVFKKTAFTNPATGFSRSIQYLWDGTNWIEFSRGAADVAN